MAIPGDAGCGYKSPEKTPANAIEARVRLLEIKIERIFKIISKLNERE